MALLRELIQPASLERCGDRSFPVLSMTMHDGIMLQSDRFKKSLASVDQSAYKVVRRNQLVVGFPIDEGVLYIQQVADAGIMSPAYDVWNVDETKVNLQYFELCLHSPQSMMFYKTNLRGTTARRRSLPKETLLSLPVPVPSVERQREIASTIGRLKELIELRQRQLRTLDTLIKARFVEMFGDPVVNPKTWPLKPFLKMGSCKNGMNFHYNDSGIEIHCLGVGDFQDHSIISDTTVLPMVSLNEMPSTEYLLQDNDIVFVRSNGNKALVGRSVAVYPGGVPTTFSGFCIRYRKQDECITIPYLLRVLKADTIRKKMAGRGVNIQNLNQQILGTLSIPVPPIELQEEFNAFVTQVDKSKSIIQQALAKDQLLFDSLMQKYFG